MLNVQRLKILREVAARGSFSAAADALDYTQSAVSQAIATLEGELGVPLLERDRRRVRPTAAGAALVDHTDGILARIEAAEAEVEAIAGVRGGHLRIASFPTAGATLVPAAIANFRAAHPDVSLSLAEGEPDEIASRLRGGEFDLALLFEFAATNGKLGTGLRRFDLLEDPMHLVMATDHPLAAKPKLRLKDLASESWVQTSAGGPCARHVVRSCHEAGFEPTVSFESDDYQTVQGLVAARAGIALVPQLALTSVRPDIVVRALHPASPVRKVLAATRRGAAVMPAVATMVDVLRSAAARYEHTAAAEIPGPRSATAAPA